MKTTETPAAACPSCGAKLLSMQDMLLRMRGMLRSKKGDDP